MNRVVILAALVLALPTTAQVSRDQALAKSQEQIRGRILSVDRSDVQPQPVWRIKILTPQGEVRVVLIEADI